MEIKTRQVIEWPDAEEVLGEEKLKRFAKQELQRIIALSERNLSQGKQLDGSPMKPYSESYSQALSASGQSTVVDLSVGGALRRSRQISDSPRGVQAKFEGGHAKSNISFRPARGAGGESRTSREVRGGGRSSRGGRSGRRSGGGGGRAISNAQLAESLINRGFTGWHEFPPGEEAKIRERFAKLLLREYLGGIKTTNR